MQVLERESFFNDQTFHFCLVDNKMVKNNWNRLTEEVTWAIFRYQNIIDLANALPLVSLFNILTTFIKFLLLKASSILSHLCFTSFSPKMLKMQISVQTLSGPDMESDLAFLAWFLKCELIFWWVPPADVNDCHGQCLNGGLCKVRPQMFSSAFGRCENPLFLSPPSIPV